MHAFRTICAFLLLLAGCATAPPVPEPAWYVVRHLHTPAGERDPDLTTEGQSSALVLADRLSGAGIGAIYVSDFKRTRQTAAPLAQRLGLEPFIYDPADTPGLIARVRAEERPVLIVGHSNTVPDIVEQLGGGRPPPMVHEDFGDVWRIGRDGTTIRFNLAE